MSSVRSLRLAPGDRSRHPQALGRAPVPPAVGQAHHPRPDRVGHLEGHPDRPHPRRDRDRLAVPEPPRLGVPRVHEERAAVASLHQTRAVVHPGVVAPQVPPADELEGPVGRGRPQGEEGPAQVLDQPGRREVDPPARGAEPAGEGGLEGPEVQAVRVPAEPAPGEAPAERDEPGPVGTEAQEEADDAVGTEPAEGRPGETALQGRPVPRGLEPSGELEQDLPVVPGALGGGEQGGRPLRGVAHREGVEDEVVVGPLEGGRGREDEMGVARGLVAVRVDRDHEIEPGEGPLEAGPVGGGEHRVAGDGHERPHLAGAGSLDLLGEGGHRPLPRELREAADPAASLVEVPPLPDPLGEGHRVGGGPGEHHPARTVEVSGQHVEDGDEPRGDRAELLGAHADPAVGGRRGRGGEIGGQLADRRRGEAGAPPHRLGGERPRRLLHHGQAVGHPCEPARAHAPLREEDVDDRREQEHVGPRPDRQVEVGEGRGLGAAGVDDHEAPAPGAQRPEPPLDPGGGHEAAVRSEGVRAEHEQEVRAVDVGDRQEELVAEHQEGGEHLGELVHRGGRVAAAAAQALEEELAEEDGAVAVHHRVAEVNRGRAPAVGLLDGGQALGRLGERLVPAHLDPSPRGAPLGTAQAVGVLVEVLEGDRLRAEVAAAERVVLVAADREDVGAVRLDLDAAHGFAEVAGAEVGAGDGHG